MDGRTDELIQMQVDNEISAAEKAELDAALAADREARESLDSFQSLARELDAIPRVDPPPLLAARILRNIRGQHPARSAAAPPAPASRRLAVAVAYAAAAGLILGLLAGPLLMRAELFRSDGLPGAVAGAMGTAEISSWDVLSRRGAATPAGNVVLTVRHDDGRYAIEVAPEGMIGSTVDLSWDPARLSLLALVRDRSSGPIEAHPGNVTARIADGDRLTVVLTGAGESGAIHLGINGVRLLSSPLALESRRK